MCMSRGFGDRQRVRLLASYLAECVAATHVDWRPALEVRQGEVHPSVAAERRAQQREQRLVLIDGQQLPVAKSPPLRRKGEAHDADLGQERFSHRRLLSEALQVEPSRRRGGGGGPGVAVGGGWWHNPRPNSPGWGSSCCFRAGQSR